MASKRSAGSDLNHENWDAEEEAEVAGQFVKAPNEVLRSRVIKVAKRRHVESSQEAVSNTTDSEKSKRSGIFGGFAFTNTTNTNSNSASAFGFLSNLTASQTNTGSKSNGMISQPAANTDYYAKLKSLNESVLIWIEKHVRENPLLDLRPVFTDYNKYFEDLEAEKTQETESGNTNKAPLPTFQFGIQPPKIGSTSPPQGAPWTGFNFQSTSSDSKNADNPFSAVSPPSLAPNSSAPAPMFMMPTQTHPSTENNTEADDAEDDESPPKVEFKAVIEDGHVFTIRCKVFVKRDDSYVTRGIGNLFLKPIPGTQSDNVTKHQLIVRAETNLGQLLCNFVLSKNIPMKRIGKNDVMLVCLPTPDTKPPPVPILLRVKTEQDADNLLATLEKHTV